MLTILDFFNIAWIFNKNVAEKSLHTLKLIVIYDISFFIYLNFCIIVLLKK